MGPPAAGRGLVEARIELESTDPDDGGRIPPGSSPVEEGGWTLRVRFPATWESAVRQSLAGKTISSLPLGRTTGSPVELRLRGARKALHAWGKALGEGRGGPPKLGREVEDALHGFFRRSPLSLRLGGGRKLRVGERPLVMGVLNVTPDSFYDGGRYAGLEDAVEEGLALVSEGADFLDVGGESTRPGASPLPVATELRRVLPVVERLRRESSVPISVDTRRPEVAKAVLRAGAHLINDVGGLRLPALRRVIAREEAGAVVMHMRGTPRTMQSDTRYTDVRAEIFSYLHERLRAAEKDGISREALLVDPGIGFGKSYAANWELLRHLRELRALGRPVLVGVSRKGFLGEALGGVGPDGRLEASLAAALLAAERGADVLRVHDVAPTRRALSVLAPMGRAGLAAASPP